MLPLRPVRRVRMTRARWSIVLTACSRKTSAPPAGAAMYAWDCCGGHHLQPKQHLAVVKGQQGGQLARIAAHRRSCRHRRSIRGLGRQRPGAVQRASTTFSPIAALRIVKTCRSGRLERAACWPWPARPYCPPPRSRLVTRPPSWPQRGLCAARRGPASKIPGARTIALDYAGMVTPQMSRFFAAVTVTMGPRKAIATPPGARHPQAARSRPQQAQKPKHARARSRFGRERSSTRGGERRGGGNGAGLVNKNAAY
jgi:hypothetical protein